MRAVLQPSQCFSACTMDTPEPHGLCDRFVSSTCVLHNIDDSTESHSTLGLEFSARICDVDISDAALPIIPFGSDVGILHKDGAQCEGTITGCKSATSNATSDILVKPLDLYSS